MSGCSGQSKGEPASSAKSTGHSKITTDLPRQSLSNGEAKSKSFAAVPLTVVYLSEVIKDMPQMFFGNPFARVNHVNRHHGAADVNLQVDGSVVRDFDRVVIEVLNDPLDFYAISTDD